jgi:iron complex outermembrane receptor protein
MTCTSRATCRLAALALAGLWGLAAPATAEERKPAGAGEAASLWGVVMAPDGSRLGGAVVTLARAEGGTVRVAAGALGVYRASGLAPGTWTLRVHSPGFAPARRGPWRLAPGESREVDVRLEIAALSDEVTVVGGREGSLEAPQVRESGARDAGAALAVLPGVWPLRKGGIANDVVVRGLQSRDLNVLVDGERVYGACPNHMDPPPFHVDLSEVERIEVAKGPFDVRHQGSLGGVVNLVTRDPEKGLHAAPQLSLGSFGYVNPSATLSWAGDRGSALGGFSYRTARADRDGDGLRFTERANYRAEEVDARAFRAGSGWARARYFVSADSLLEAAYTRQEADDVFYPYLTMDAAWDDTDRLSVSFESRRSPRRTLTLLTAQAYLTRVDHWMTDAARTTSAGTPRGYSMGTRARARTWGGKAGVRIGRTTGGIEAYRREWDASTELAGMGYAVQASIPDVRVDVLGLWAEYSRILGDRVLLEAGGRLDVARSDADPEKASTALYLAYLGTASTSSRDLLPSGKLRVAWRPVEGWQLSLGAGHTARVPEATERYFGLRRMGTDWVGDPGLRPSRNTGLEAAVAWRGSRALVKGSLFASRVEDLITVREVDRQAPEPGVPSPRARTWANVDATLRGGEASFSVTATDRIFLSGDVSWVRGAQEPRPGENIFSARLPEMPPLRAGLGLRYDDGRVFGAVDATFVADQDRVNEDLREEPTPGYGLANVAAGWRNRRLSVTMGVTNLFDRPCSSHLSYQRDPFRTGQRVLDPGRSAYVNLSYRF